MTIAIRVENLGKKYKLRHQQETVKNYKALRDVITDKFRGAFSSKSKSVEMEEFWAVKDVSFEIKQGEAVGIIGRNGAGKSTLLKLLSRITEPSKGRIELEGRVSSLLEVGTGFHPELTGRENVYLNGAIMGMPRVDIKRKFDEIVAFAEVEKFLDTPVKRYSSGMYMRLAFAVAAHLDPDIMVVDEVLAVGDLEFQKKCLGKMEDASKGGRTVLFVSHNMDAIQRMCSRCILLNRGEVEVDCDTRQAVAHYIQKKASQDPLVDLRNAKRSWDPRRKAEFMSVKPSRPGEGEGWIIPYGEPLAFEIRVDVKGPLRELEIGIAISTATEVQFTANLSSERLPIQNVVAGSYACVIAFPGLRLIPGDYHALIWMRSEAGSEDFIFKAFEFEIGISQLSSLHRTDSFNSILVPEAEFSFERLDSPAGALRD
jgi:lipopolysaccharide transport system ATP-binding protein